MFFNNPVFSAYAQPLGMIGVLLMIIIFIAVVFMLLALLAEAAKRLPVSSMKNYGEKTPLFNESDKCKIIGISVAIIAIGSWEFLAIGVPAIVLLCLRKRDCKNPSAKNISPIT
ncbi:MAG: hypothetical protein WC520_02120 [Candidatus Paceibacterota bacterium]